MTKDEKILTLDEYAVAHPDGFTYQDVERDLGWKRTDLYEVVRWLRHFYETDEMTLTATPQGQSEPWLYMLVGRTEEAGPWSRNRLLDTETRLSTMHAVTQTLVNALDGRTIEGKKARLMERTLRHLQENLTALNNGEI